METKNDRQKTKGEVSGIRAVLDAEPKSPEIKV